MRRHTAFLIDYTSHINGSHEKLVCNSAHTVCWSTAPKAYSNMLSTCAYKVHTLFVSPRNFHWLTLNIFLYNYMASLLITSQMSSIFQNNTPEFSARNTVAQHFVTKFNFVFLLCFLSLLQEKFVKLATHYTILHNQTLLPWPTEVTYHSFLYSSQWWSYHMVTRGGRPPRQTQIAGRRPF